VNFANVPADAFGNALGNSIAYSATASSNGAQQIVALDNAEAEAWSGNGLKPGGGLGLKVPSALAATWGEPTYGPLADPAQSAYPAQPSFPTDSVGWVPDELRGRRDLLFYRQQELGYGRTLVSFNPEIEDAPVIPGLTMTSEGMKAYRASPADPWTSERIYVPADPLGRANAIDQGNGVWSYPVSLADNIEVRELPPLTTQDEFQSKAEQGTFDRWNELGNAVTNGNLRRAW
jgi:hypothetical protein